MWVAVTSLMTVFLIRMSRGGQGARELLGESFCGILVTDRYSAYNINSCNRSVCIGTYGTRPKSLASLSTTESQFCLESPDTRSTVLRN